MYTHCILTITSIIPVVWSIVIVHVSLVQDNGLDLFQISYPVSHPVTFLKRMLSYSFKRMERFVVLVALEYTIMSWIGGLSL